jgi:ubiquinone/menaquinone biosynthesis C-methylase UbiE
MRSYPDLAAVLEQAMPFAGRTVIDVGCGAGETVRWLAGRGARAIGLDNANMLAKARRVPPCREEEYVQGGAQKMPFADQSADVILFQASFHHVPVAAMSAAVAECLRVLKKDGRAVFIEPVYRAGAYSEITRLVEDEEEIQKAAYAAIVALAGSGLNMEKEFFFYVPRSFADYVHLVEFFADNAQRRQAVLARAQKITETYSRAAGSAFADFCYRSICRLNILRRGGSGENTKRSR